MNLKLLAARHALDHVRSGMTLGLGTGSTTTYFIDLLGEHLTAGALEDIRAVPTSEGTATRARAHGIPLVSLKDYPRLDLAVDGADEVDPNLDLIKGLGRALLREKVVETHTDHLLILVDESKMVPRLGSTVPLPVEILPFEHQAHIQWLSTLGCQAEWRMEKDGSPVVTDNGNYMALCHFPEGIPDVHALARKMADRPGIIEHGIFLEMTWAVIIAGADGVRTLEAR
jgi:ribose 5-phosphate isomerase A